MTSQRIFISFHLIYVEWQSAGPLERCHPTKAILQTGKQTRLGNLRGLRKLAKYIQRCSGITGMSAWMIIRQKSRSLSKIRGTGLPFLWKSLMWTIFFTNVQQGKCVFQLSKNGEEISKYYFSVSEILYDYNRYLSVTNRWIWKQSGKEEFTK